MVHGSLPRKLRVLRARQGLSLIEAAEKLGIGRDTLSDLERGNRHPVMPTLAKIAQGYGVPVEDLLEEPALAVGKDEAPTEGAGPHTLEELLEQAGIPGPYWLTQPTEEFKSFWRGVSFEEARDRFLQIRREHQVLKEELNRQMRGEPSGAPELQERMVDIYQEAFGRHFYALAAAPGKEESKGAFRAREQRGDTRPLGEVVPGVPGAGDAIEDSVG